MRRLVPRAILTILNTWLIAAVNAETVFEVYNKTTITQYDDCGKVINWDRKCKTVDPDSDKICKNPGQPLIDTTFMKMHAIWEQQDNCRTSMDYFRRAMINLRKQSGWVYNITTNWTAYFDSQSKLIIGSAKSAFICQFAAKRYLQIRDLNFFHGVWQPAAIKCSNFLGEARRALMCSVCSTNDTRYFKNGSNHEIYLNWQSCHNFMEACVDYIKSKQEFITKLNVIFTLALCDKEGIYRAQGQNKMYYKQVLPSEVNFDDENIEFCKGHVKKDPSISAEQSQLNENACFDMCHRYFGQGLMIEDDLKNFDNLQFMHDILKEIVGDNFHERLFHTRSGPSSLISLDFGYVTYKFYPSNSTEGINLERHAKDNGFKAFDSSLCIKTANVQGFCSVLFLLMLVALTVLR